MPAKGFRAPPPPGRFLRFERESLGCERNHDGCDRTQIRHLELSAGKYPVEHRGGVKSLLGIGKRFSEEQITGALKEAEAGLPVAEPLRKHGIAQGTLCRWKAKHGGLEVNEASRLRGSEEENRRLERPVADPALAIRMPKDACSEKW